MALALLPAVTCAPGPEPPAGTVLSADGGAARRLLARAARFRGTPLGRTAAALGDRIAGCAEVTAFCPLGAECELAETLECGRGALPQGVARAPEVDLLFQRPLEGGGVLQATATVDDAGSMAARIELPAGGDIGAFALLAPAAEPAGPQVLRDEEALVHLRLRADGGLDLSPFVTGDGWGARVFQLKSELFLGAALAGVWELAVYPPAPGERIPPVALALDHKDRRRAVQVMEAFVERILETWPARRGPYEHGGFGGGCLGNLRVLPELAPCYVATDRALVVGWNRRSVELGLAAGERKAVAAGTVAAVYFDRLPEADVRLAEASGGDPEAAPEYPWRLLRLVGGREGDVYRLAVALEASP